MSKFDAIYEDVIKESGLLPRGAFRAKDVEAITKRLKELLPKGESYEKAYEQIASQQKPLAKLKNKFIGSDPEKIVTNYFAGRTSGNIPSTVAPLPPPPPVSTDTVKKRMGPLSAFLLGSAATAGIGALGAGYKYKQMQEDTERQKLLALAKGMGLGMALPELAQQNQASPPYSSMEQLGNMAYPEAAIPSQGQRYTY